MSEFTAKGVFLYNLTRFVQWPPDSGEQNFSVCVVQGSPLDKVVPSVFSGKTIAGKSAEVRLISSTKKIPPCQLLFIPGDDRREIDAYVRGVEHGSTLIVGDSMTLLRGGGMLSIILVDLRLELFINHARIRSGGFQLSPELLRLAKDSSEK